MVTGICSAWNDRVGIIRLSILRLKWGMNVQHDKLTRPLKTCSASDSKAQITGPGSRGMSVEWQSSTDIYMHTAHRTHKHKHRHRHRHKHKHKHKQTRNPPAYTDHTPTPTHTQTRGDTHTSTLELHTWLIQLWVGSAHVLDLLLQIVPRRYAHRDPGQRVVMATSWWRPVRQMDIRWEWAYVCAYVCVRMCVHVCVCVYLPVCAVANKMKIQPACKQIARGCRRGVSFFLWMFACASTFARACVFKFHLWFHKGSGQK